MDGTSGGLYGVEARAVLVSDLRLQGLCQSRPGGFGTVRRRSMLAGVSQAVATFRTSAARALAPTWPETMHAFVALVLLGQRRRWIRCSARPHAKARPRWT